MNLKFNKIIAKEIIYFSLIILVSILIWSFIEFNNYYLQNKNQKINNEISNNNKNLTSLKAKILTKSRYKQLDDNLLILHQNGASDSDIILFYNDFVNKFKNKEIVEKRNVLISKNKNATLVIFQYENKVNISIVVKDTADAINIKNLNFDKNQLTDFLTKEPKDRRLVFAIGLISNGQLSLTATREPFSPLLLDKYEIK